MKLSAHHVLFYRRCWNKGYSHRLRRLFVFEISDDVHKKLHEVVGAVPVLEEYQARELYIEYRKLDHKPELEEALKWLVLHAPTTEFAMAIMAQLCFIQNYDELSRGV